MICWYASKSLFLTSISNSKVIDASSWAIKKGRVLGNHRHVLSAGFFDRTWQW